MPPGHWRTAQPTDVVLFHTTWVKWPIGLVETTPGLA